MTQECGIYVFTTPSNSAYIGSSANVAQRKRQHMHELNKGDHHCIGLQRAFDKYGDRLTFAVIQHCSVDDLLKFEQWWIDNALLMFKAIYNSSKTAGKVDHTPEVRAKMSAAAKGRIPSLETRARMAEAGRNRAPISEETRMKLSRRAPSAETIAKRVAKLKGQKRNLSPEALASLRASAAKTREKRWRKLAVAHVEMLNWMVQC